MASKKPNDCPKSKFSGKSAASGRSSSNQGEEEDPKDFQEVMLMLEFGMPVSAETYNNAIKFLSFQRDNPMLKKYAKKYFLQMIDRGMRPDSSTYTFLMEAIACQADSKAKAVEEAREFLKQIEDKGLVFNSGEYFEFHDCLEEAFDMLRLYDDATKTTDEEMKQIFLSSRADRSGVMELEMNMFNGLVEDGLMDEAIKLFDLIFETGISPPTVLHTTIIEAYVTAGKIKGAFEAFVRMLVAGVTPNSYTYSVIIKTLAADPNFFAIAKKYLLEMTEKGMQPNAGTYTAVFEGLVKKGDKGMKAKGFVLDEDAVGEAVKGKSAEVVKGIMTLLFGKYDFRSWLKRRSERTS